MTDFTATNRIGPIDPKTAGEVMFVYNTVAVPITLAATDVCYMQIYLPHGCVPVNCVLYATDLDTDASPAIALDVGIAAATDPTVAADPDAFVDGATVGQAGGTVHGIAAAGLNLAAHPTQNREVTVTVATVAATKAAGTIGVGLYYRAAQANE